MSQEPSRSKSTKLRMINVVSISSQVGSSKRAKEEDEDAPLVISLDIGNCIVRRILVDTGSVANILLRSTIAKKGISEEAIQPCQVPLIGFTGRSTSTGIVNLPVQVHGTKWNVEFLVVEASSSYNGLLFHPALNQMKSTVSTYSFTLEVRTNMGLFTIRGDRVAG